MICQLRDWSMPELPFKILGIEHVGIAVSDIDKSHSFFGELLGIPLSGSEEVQDQKVLTDIFNTGNGKIELLQPTESDSVINKFIEMRGAGMHHLALIVDNLQAALDYLNENDVQLIDKSPRTGAEGLKIAFIHPKSTGGVLVELCENK
jgi:methylmalonyl-CoA/ethylmalonyl-CoA epimerase